jgi:adenylate cyclase
MPASPDPGLPPERPQVPRPPRPPRPPGGRDGAPDVLPPGTEPVDDVVGALLGEPRTMRRRQVSAAAEVSLLSARRFWHALGFPNVGDEDTVFTAADLQALRSVVGLVREGVFEETTALSMIRALGRTTDRLAVWQTQLMAEALGDLPEVDARTGLLDADGASSDTSRAVPDPATARAAALRLTEIADRLEPLLVYAWRRHLSAAISRMVADAEPADDHTGIVRSVGFADLVSFTTLVRRMSERQLAQVVQRFEALTSDVVTAHGGRVIKTVGDEVLFVTIGTAPAAAIALDLVQAMGDDDFLPDVRVGMAFGQVVSRLGDVFGTTVNRASRLTGVARPGTVLVDDALAASLASLSGFEMRPLRRRTLRGIGPVTPWELRRAEQGARRGMVAGGDTPYGDDEPTPDEGDA